MPQKSKPANNNMTTIKCIIMDWAGTAVDFGCFAPLDVFLNVFRERGVPLTYREAREPMGLPKIDHIRALLAMPAVQSRFVAAHGRASTEEDVRALYAGFEHQLLATLESFATPLPGVVETIGLLKERNIRIGSTTGYTSGMMDVVRPAAARQGYEVDHLVTPDATRAGRPAPYMIFRNMIDLGVPSVRQVVKVGDTLSDIREGLHAGVHTVGVVTGSSELGLSLEEYAAMPPGELEGRKQAVRARMLAAGAHEVLDSIADLPAWIERIENAQ